MRGCYWQDAGSWMLGGGAVSYGHGQAVSWLGDER